MGVPEDSADVIGRRIGAGLLDLAALVVLLIVVGLIFGQAHAGGGSASVSLHGASAVVWAVLGLAYYLVPEAISGRTLGKLLLGLRVARSDGGRPSFGAIAVRTVMRIVDFLPVFYLLGLVVILTTGGRQRLGDLVAGTKVRRG